MRPWKGPIPKRGPPVLTLAAFLPDSRQRQRTPVRLSREELIEKARGFGRSIWDLIPNEPAPPPPLASLAASFANVVRRPAMPPFPRADQGRGRGINHGRCDARGNGDYAGGGMHQSRAGLHPGPEAPHPAGRGHGGHEGPAGREVPAGRGGRKGHADYDSAGRGTLPGRGGGDAAPMPTARSSGLQQYVPVRVAGKANSNQQGSEREQHQQEQDELKKKRSFCFRCKSNGHVNENCKTNLDCIICNKRNSHLSSKCPRRCQNLMQLFLGRGKEFAFIRISDVDYKLKTPDPSPTGLVTVTGGHILAEVVQSELASITRTDWK